MITIYLIYLINDLIKLRKGKEPKKKKNINLCVIGTYFLPHETCRVVGGCDKLTLPLLR